MKQKHYLDIENLRETDTEFRPSNAKGFIPGDIISITEKIDGANTCVCYDKDTHKLAAFSRRQILDYINTLNGFWNLVQSFDIEPFEVHPTWRVFGEWSGARNKIVYDERFKNKWIVYSIYDTDREEWLVQNDVKMFCWEYGFKYIHEMYYGPFISWDHCRSFLNSPAYGDRQEGIVIRNISRINNPDSRTPFILKIVNDDFRESVKIIDKNKEDAREKALDIVRSIVTENRVEKELFKMRDEGIVPPTIQPSDMKVVAQNLPKRIYDDCIKEEKELVLAAGEFFGKLCGQQTMKIARKLIMGE